MAAHIRISRFADWEVHVPAQCVGAGQRRALLLTQGRRMTRRSMSCSGLLGPGIE